MNVKITTRKVSDSVVEHIEEMIESGKFGAGEKLPSVRELCEMFGVGRSAVRDAITTLKGKGTVYVKQGEGTYICAFDSTKLFTNPMLLPGTKDIRELFQVRKILEAGIAEMAAVNRSEEDLEIIGGILGNRSNNGWESDYHLHMAIAKATGNEIIIQLIQFISATMKKAMSDFHSYIQKNQETVNAIEEQHERIYESIKLANPEKAKQMMIEHLDFVQKELTQSHVLQHS